jgi:malate dehydrogenase (oxaloacetate-decarboxylating)
MVDSKGILSKHRADLNPSKRELLSILRSQGKTLEEAMRGADIFIGVSAPGIVSEQMVRSMNTDAIVFSMANPVPEIMPLTAKKAGARVVASGRSDFPNQINNSLSFPGIFRGLLDYRVSKLLVKHKVKAAEALAALVKKPREDYIIPDSFDTRVVPAVREAMR